MCDKIFGILLTICILSHVAAQEKTKGDLIEQVSRSNGDAKTEQPVTSRTPNLTPGTGSCTCVPYYRCKNGSVNSNNREGTIDIAFNEGSCETYIDVCCEKGNEVDVPITPTPPVQRPRCGTHIPEGIDIRISINGNDNHEAQYGEFPWMVAVLAEETIEGNPKKLDVYKCGGALIHPQVVVTAAHCVTAKRPFKIRAGEWDTQTTKELYDHQEREVESIVSHSQYYAGALFNDIALLFLKSPVDIAEHINVVCLPPQNTNVDHSRCFTSGWGKDLFGKEGRYQVILKKIDLPVVPRDSCQEKLRTTRLGKDFELHKSFICAGGEPDRDTCIGGDGGAPLVCPIPGEKDRYQQAGIVAWRIGCGQNNAPGVFVNVALFRDWIDEKMKEKGLETDSYQY